MKITTQDGSNQIERTKEFRTGAGEILSPNKGWRVRA